MQQYGLGTVVSNQSALSEGECDVYKITPAEGSYIALIEFNGTASRAFDAFDTTYTTPPLTENSQLVVEFRELPEEGITVTPTPYFAKFGRKIYTFSKIIGDTGTVSESGVLFSRSNAVPTVGGKDVIKIPSAHLADNKGYYGFEFDNNTFFSSITFYVRPYVIYGDNFIVSNEIVHVDTSLMADFKLVNWFEDNNLNDVGLIVYEIY